MAPIGFGFVLQEYDSYGDKSAESVEQVTVDERPEDLAKWSPLFVDRRSWSLCAGHFVP